MRLQFLSRMSVLIAVLAVTVWTTHAQDKCTQVPAERPQNRKIVISDLHLGIGQPNGRWSPLEDFRFAALFRSFLESKRTSGNTDLIIAGDFIDFWQVLPELDEKRSPQLGSTEAESLAKLEVVLIQHRDTFADLKRFAQTGRNRLIIIPGNHDVDLFWPLVQARLQRELGLALNQKLFFTNACYESQGVHVEHGQQYDEANSFKNPNAPFVPDDNGTRRLETNWGTVFMSRFYNKIEIDLPFIDNLTPELSGIVWAVQNNVIFSFRQMARLSVMLIRDQKALAQAKMFARKLGADEPPKKVPEKTVDNLFKLYESVDPELAKTLRATVKTEEDRKEAESALKEISAEEWATLQAGFEKVEPTETLENTLRGRDPYIQGAGSIIIKKPDISVVVMAHTHELDSDVFPLDDFGVRNKWYVNTGCWQKVLKVRTAKENGKKWAEITLDDPIFPLRFSYVTIDYSGDKVTRPVRSFWTP